MAIRAAKGTIRNGVCTSGTRPSAPYVGQMIYETDTNLLKIWLGAAWSDGQGLGAVVGSVEVLVVAGGASGARSEINGAGGGGAGGYLEGTFSVSIGSTYTVTVGAGGAARVSAANGASGSNSVFATATALGGGGGGIYAAVSGGSGGGGGNNEAGGAATQTSSGGLTGFGNAGAASGDGGWGGGGGGAGGAGGLTGALSPIRRNAGVGKSSSITGSSVTYSTGGTYPNTGTAINGTANTGDGGSGHYQATSGAGGSGVVVLRYPTTFLPASSVTGTPIVTEVSGFRIYRFTGSGSITFS
jgi:hypothetical protein